MKINLSVMALLLASPTSALADNCHPETTSEMAQFVVGYGSLMERESKAFSAPTAGPSHPVRVPGFKRSWNDPGSSPGFSTTYLGVEIDKTHEMVAAIYSDPDGRNIRGSDAREISYCRHQVDPGQIELLDGWELSSNAQVWIYVNKPDHIAAPDEGHPIVQSYVDIFLSGCIQLQSLVLPEVAGKGDFPSQCIETTHGWSAHWKNDRIHPRRPYMDQHNAFKIDALLSRLLPKFFEQIEIE
jgi:hypothetical protein